MSPLQLPRPESARLLRPTGGAPRAWPALAVLLLAMALLAAHPPGQPPAGAPGQFISTRVSLTAPEVPGLLDALAVLDATESYRDSLPTVTTQLGDAVRELQSASSLQLAVSGFADGVAGDPALGYQPLLPLGPTDAASVERAVGSLEISDGGDKPEQSNDGVLAILQASAPALRQDSRRVLLLATDDASRPDGPSTEAVASALAREHVRVLALVPRGASAPDAEQLAAATGGSTLRVERSGEDLASAILAGLHDLPQDVLPQLDPGCPLTEPSFDPPARYGAAGGEGVRITVRGRVAADAAPGTYRCTVTSPGTSTSFKLEVQP